MIRPKELARGGLDAAAARRREREAERATERLSDVVPPVPVADPLDGVKPRQSDATAPALEPPAVPAREAAQAAAPGDETTQRPDARLP
jgi:hypothetical protein